LIFFHPFDFILHPYLYRAEVIVHSGKAMVEAKERGQDSLNEVEKEGFFAEMAKRYPAT
jgi:hypothetical protein